MDTIKCLTCAKYEPIAFPNMDGTLQNAGCGYCGGIEDLKPDEDICSEYVVGPLFYDLAREDK